MIVCLMKKIKKLSVITVCLNCIETIELTLASIRQQTFDNVEHVVIDGGSADGSAEIIKTYQVDYFVSEPDDGIYHAMEKGVAAATGDVLIFLNSGDIFYDQKVCEDVVSFFNQTNSDIVFGDFCPYKINENDNYDHASFQPGKVCRLNSVTNRKCLKYRNIHHQALFYSRIIFDKCSFFSKEWPQGSDYELNVQAMVKQCLRAKYFNRVVTKFALGGVSTSNFDKEREQIDKLKAIINDKYFKTPIHCDENEYIYRQEIFNRTKLKQFLMKTLPYRFVKLILNRFVTLIINELDRRLDFTIRTDSIYEQVEKLTSVISNQRESIIGLHLKIDNQRESIIGLHLKIDNQRESIIGLHLKIDNLHESIIGLHHKISKNRQQYLTLNTNIAKLLKAQFKDQMDINQAGYKVTSQFDEDGIIQYLIDQIYIPNRVFVEFGVENYTEANTIFLLEKDNWAGLVIDASAEYINQIKQKEIYWKHNLKAKSAFVSCENINELILNAGISGDIGLLSIDIDGVDYWVWDAIKVISPRIVICEYNSIFGWNNRVTVPYDPNFDRTKKHYSHLYAGASLGALADLADKKGYSLVASNTNGNNAFFVRNDCMNKIQAKPVEAVYVKTQIRESRGQNGEKTYLSIEEGIKLIHDLLVFNIITQREILVKELTIKYD